MEEMQVLKGKKIEALQIHGDKSLIEFLFEDGSRVYLRAEGDCCSQSWFEHFEGIDALIGQVIVEIEDRAMPVDHWDKEHGELTQFYGWQFTTQRGRALLEMRNASNGYYGGNVSVLDNLQTKYSWGRNYKARDLRPLQEDF